MSMDFDVVGARVAKGRRVARLLRDQADMIALLCDDLSDAAIEIEELRDDNSALKAWRRGDV